MDVANARTNKPLMAVPNKVKRLAKEYVEQNGEATTHEILEHINAHSKSGTSLKTLNNVLGKSSEFIKIQTDRCYDRGRRWTQSVWQLNDDSFLKE